MLSKTVQNIKLKKKLKNSLRKQKEDRRYVRAVNNKVAVYEVSIHERGKDFFHLFCYKAVNSTDNTNKN
jgi:hypothetical protein